MSVFLLFFDMLITQIIIITIHFTSTWVTLYHIFLPHLMMETILRFYFGLRNIRMMICGMYALPTQSDWAVSVYFSPTESSAHSKNIYGMINLVIFSTTQHKKLPERCQS